MSQENTGSKQQNSETVSIALRTDVDLNEDDLTEEAKRRFPFHTDILRAHQLTKRNVFANDRFSPVGRHLLALTLEGYYANCKNVLNYMASHSQASDSMDPIPTPIFICGVPRTGTTMLCNLLACDPNSRALLLADMIEPVPPLARSDTAKQMERNQRLAAFEKMYDALGLKNYLPELRASHPAYPYDEDIFLLLQSGVNFLFYLLVAIDNVEYTEWFLDRSGKDSGYQYHKTFMQMVNSVDAPRSHWILKNPIHPLYLDTLMRHYPNASLIMTHRRLDEVLPSGIRVSLAFTNAFFDQTKPDIHLDREAVAKHYLKAIDAALHRMVEFRRNHTSDKILDLLYEDLVDKPIETVRRIYQHYGLSWSDSIEQAMVAWLKENPQGKHGRTGYSLEEFGLNRDTINEQYKDYNNMFLKCSSPTEAHDDIQKLESATN